MEKRSFRRKLLDTILSQTTFTGSVLDVGGKKSGQRGHFRAPYEQVKSWKYKSHENNPMKPSYSPTQSPCSISFELMVKLQQAEVIERILVMGLKSATCSPFPLHLPFELMLN